MGGRKENERGDTKGDRKTNVYACAPSRMFMLKTVCCVNIYVVSVGFLFRVNLDLSSEQDLYYHRNYLQNKVSGVKIQYV